MSFYIALYTGIAGDGQKIIRAQNSRKANAKGYRKQSILHQFLGIESIVFDNKKLAAEYVEG